MERTNLLPHFVRYFFFAILDSFPLECWRFRTTIGIVFAPAGSPAFLSLGLGFGAALGLVWLVGQLVPLAVPGLALILTQTTVIRVLLASLFIGVMVALVPAWQVAQLDPVAQNEEETNWARTSR